MIHAQVALANLKASLYRKPGKGNPQQLFQGDPIGFRQQVRDEIFDFIRVENIAGNDQRMGRSRQAVISLFAIKSCMLDLPHNRPIFTVLDVIRLPLLILENTGIYQQIPYFAGRQRLLRQTREMAFSSSFMAFLRGWPHQNFRFIQPTGKVRRDFADIVLTAGLKAIQKVTVTAIPGIKSPGRYANAVLQRTRDLAQRDVRFLAIDHVVRNARLLAACRIIGPAFRKIYVAVQKALKITRDIADMYAHHTIVSLAGVAAPLPLDAGGILSLFGIARIINQPNRRRVSMIRGHCPLQPVAEPKMIPLQQGQKALQSTGLHLGRQRHRFNALSRQVGQLAVDIGTQVPPRADAGKTVIKLRQKCVQFFTNTFNLCNIHSDSPYKHHAYKKLSTLPTGFLEQYLRRSISFEGIITKGMKLWNKTLENAEKPHFWPKKGMRMRGVEPPRANAHRHLKPARLPIPPHPRKTYKYSFICPGVKIYFWNFRADGGGEGGQWIIAIYYLFLSWCAYTIAPSRQSEPGFYPHSARGGFLPVERLFRYRRQSRPSF